MIYSVTVSNAADRSSEANIIQPFLSRIPVISFDIFRIAVLVERPSLNTDGKGSGNEN